MNLTDIQTLIEMLAVRAEATPDRTAFTFNNIPCTFATLWDRVTRFGALLMARGVRYGDRVIAVMPNGHEFFTVFYGVQRAGGTVVPLYPGSGPQRILTIAGLCDARVIVVPSETPASQFDAFREACTNRGIQLLTPEFSSDAVSDFDFPLLSPDDVAFVQYTSGSTGNPKGVPLSHANLLTNMRQMIAGMEITADDVFVSWLPVYHDMGLILKTMVPFYLAAELHLLPASLKDVHSWLATIQQKRGTFTAAPDFAYRLCLRYIEDHSAYDLSSLRVALNAAEPVRVRTITEFEAAFGLKHVMVAGYGLAEATVGVSMWPPQTPQKVNGRGVVSVGPPFPGVEIIILADGKPAGPGVLGEIAIKSLANARGYLNNDEATRRLFWDGDTILSGDLGMVDEEGFLYIAGRKKNIIKLGGMTIYPQEIEEVVDSRPEVRYSAAVGVDRAGLAGEQIYIFAEIRGGDRLSEDALYDIALEIVSSVHLRLGHRPGRVHLVKPRTIPVTYNGKIQHAALKQRYLDGDLRAEGLILFPGY